MNNKRLSAISLGHFAIDILNSSIPIILAVLSGDLGWSNSLIGFGVMVYTFAAALSQPLFGLLADRWRGRWLAAAGLLWLMVFYALASFATTYGALITLLTIGALGSGAFHPTGIVNAADAGGKRPATATSFFFLLGQTGLSLGPFLSGLMLQRYGMASLPFLALAMTPAVVFMFWALREPMAEDEVLVTQAAGASRAKTSSAMIGLFFMVVILRSTTLQSYMTLLPKFFADMGITPGRYGLMVAAFVFAGALGTFVGGFLGDRFDRRVVMASSMVSSVPFALLMLGNLNWLYFVGAAATGALLSIPHSILLITGQDLLPKRKGMIGGLVLGLMFASGAATAWIASWFSDRVGLGLVLTLLAFVPILASIGAAFLPKARSSAAPSLGAESTPAPAAAD